MNDLHKFSVQEMTSGQANKSFSAIELVEDCLKAVEAREDVVGAWTYLDTEHVRNQARELDSQQSDGTQKDLPLRGVPVGVKDIFDTHDLPTENGTVAHKGRRPQTDATAVSLLRQAGAVIMGKTVTAELAVYSPGKTTNPHDPGRTPGGSSSGSAAAVAEGMVPLALGTQTNGSVIRPASYCGVVGYKPTFGTIPRAGVLKQSPSLDQVGVFSRTVFDSARLASVLIDQDTSHGDTVPWPGIDLDVVERQYSSSPRLAFAKTPVWNEAATSTQEACLDFIRQLPIEVIELNMPPICEQAVPCHRTIMLSEMYHNYRELYDNSRDLISPMLLSMLEEGAAITIDKYLDAKNTSMEITAAVDVCLTEYDAVLTPATPAAAPVGLASTGSPIFCTLWSLCGTPALSLPLLTESPGVPLGIQLVGARGTDSSLLRAAHWLESAMLHTEKSAGER